MNRKIGWGLFLLLLLCVWPVPAVLAHGTNITLTVVDGDQLELHALFETGEPMSEAQVVVYAADNPRQAWHTGVADTEGFYTFDVDTSIPGDWAISIRTAGHGELLHFTVSEAGVINAEQPSGRPWWQTALAAFVVLLALGGIARYYARPKAQVAQARN